ncbi:MAG: aspartate aminotransferase family protein [Rhodothermales bacterium]|nr:aspartate aminotransferase family protein [Rhodothermales bacterium]
MLETSIVETEDAFQIPTYKKFPISLERGEGVYVWDADGNRYLDFYGGHCVTLLGHCPPAVVAAIQEQAGQLMFYSNVVYSSIRARAAQRLAEMAPAGMGHAFFCNSGTEANETALKLGRTWTGKPGVVATIGGFHGRTMGSLAATWNPHYREPYQSVLSATHFIPFGDAAALEAVLQAHNDIGVFILEPIQSMAGIVDAPDAYYRDIRALCDRYRVTLVFDEVQTGVGRTGTFSISDHYGMRPDLITLAKSLGSGIPIGAVLSSDAIAGTVHYGDHGTTFGGGMVAMAAMLATLDTLENDRLMPRAPAIFKAISSALTPLVTRVRGRGCLIGLEMDRPVGPVCTRLRQLGVLVGGSDDPNVMRLMPALNTPDSAIEEFIAAFRSAIGT